MIRMDEGHVIKTDGILTADDLAPSMGVSTHREWIHAVREQSRLARLVMGHRRITDAVEGEPVSAQVEHGRWIAHCECGGTENVTPNDKVFFCFSCCNADNSFHLRPVVFPEDIDQKVIEELLMKRSKHRDMNWLPEESALSLEKENKELVKAGRAR